MDFSASMVAAPASQPAPRIVADMRPAADAAATARVTKPDLPVANPTPPANGQVAEVSRSMLTGTGLELASDNLISPVAKPERTLKPYGISMLPQSLDEANDAKAKADSLAEGIKA